MFQDLKWGLLLLPTLHTDKDFVELVWMLSHDVLLDSLLPITTSLGRGFVSCLFAFSVAALESSFLKLDRLCSEPQCVVRMDAARASAVVDGGWCGGLLGRAVGGELRTVCEEWQECAAAAGTARVKGSACRHRN